MNGDFFRSSEGFTLPLRDGELVDFRPVKQNDKETIQKGMLALSSKSRYFRFFSPILKLSDTQLYNFTESGSRYFCDRFFRASCSKNQQKSRDR